MGILSKIFPSDNDRNIKKLSKIADKIEILDEKYSKMSDEELKATTPALKQRLADGEKLDDILPDAYAVVREASIRVIGQKHYYVQLLGGVAIHQGRIAEMRTGEGKTLMETLPTYLNALTGKGVHIITVNEYLAKLASEWMGKIFRFLGLTVGITLSGMSYDEKKKAYECDITYGTNSEMGFDYLRDNMVISPQRRVQRGHYFAIIDEVDSVLIDEARTPLIISGGKGTRPGKNYEVADKFVKTLNKEIVEVDEERKQVRLTEEGVKKAETFFKIDNLSDIEHIELNHYILNALKANYIMKLDSNYIVSENQIFIVDEFTGRVMAGRRFSDGLHQAIEAKEGVEIKDENRTMATITYQNYFRNYIKLSGMTGTAKTEETEFNKIYGLDVVVIPTNKPIARMDRNDIIFKTKEGKISAIIKEVKQRNEKQQPMLIGTVTVEQSEEISRRLKKEGVKHVVLNAKNNEKESEIVADAGRLGAVTIATNMAGRGTDIMLGGNSEFLAKKQLKKEGVEPFYVAESDSHTETEDEKLLEVRKRFKELLKEYKKETEEEKKEVIEAGGLLIIGTQRHESRRIDNQLRGRSGRQGDVGESIFYVSFEDDVLRIFGGERMKRMFSFASDTEPVTNMKLMSMQVEMAQKRIEGANFSRRRTVLQFDDVLNKQREIIYAERNKVLEGKDVSDEIMDMIASLIAQIITSYISDDKMYYEWNLEELNKVLEDKAIFAREANFLTEDNIEDMEVKDVIELVTNKVIENYEAKKKEAIELGVNFAEIERRVLLKVVDSAWVEHIDLMTILKKEIFTRTDPITTYKKEGFEMFDKVISNIRENTAKIMLNGKVEKVKVNNKPQPQQTVASKAAEESRKSKIDKTVVNKEKKVGRNDPCTCGSGKKYKNCCGKET